MLISKSTPLKAMIAPTSNASRKKQSKAGFKYTQQVIWAIVGFCILALAIVLIPHDKVEEQAKIGVKKSRIEDVTPSKSRSATSQPTPKVETEKERRLRKINEGIYTDERGIKRYANGSRVPVKPDVVVDLRNLKDRKFSFASERQIADVLMINPGERLIGEIRYGEAFEEDFKNSLTNKIEFCEDDTEETVELKQAVIDTKADLAERMRKGESVAEIMAAARKEAQDIAAYRDSLKQQVNQLMEEGNLSEEDENDLFKAANAMLEQRGAKPLRMPSTLIKQLRQYMKEKKEMAQ